MAGLDDRTRANLDVALEEACRDLPHGGDHALRKKVAERLLRSARKGNTTLGGLSIVAWKALAEATKPRKSAQSDQGWPVPPAEPLIWPLAKLRQPPPVERRSMRARPGCPSRPNEV